MKPPSNKNHDIEKEDENVGDREIIRNDIDLASVQSALAQCTKIYEDRGIKIPLIEGAVCIEDFLRPEPQDLLECRAWASGNPDDASALEKVYRTARTGFGDNEVNITRADQQIPMLADLKGEMNVFLKELFGKEPTYHSFELRALTPKSSGHSRHVDYAAGYTIRTDHETGHPYALVPVSLSLPISWNVGRAPTFVVEGVHRGKDAEGKRIEESTLRMEQNRPGSLAIFGPTMYHTHPPTTDFDKPYLWLVTQAYFRYYQNATPKD